ncbi:hypothetical protein BU26DRAFT_563848 [Trematosphaeria pertusa]|uniref:Uncharacterized protein n=1 Tax=Trematosphaeria pertusa TaxID=390896 RepID=A0A6A6IIE8_9PLEO|nr:uncharacterized protein BU26DRAFT_563848 [Trematosphaeria pertusa]KAF2249957.1 hypothetical protein BU26DRAFT_563848 [Trematosphaeria pertusa]
MSTPTSSASSPDFFNANAVLLVRIPRRANSVRHLLHLLRLHSTSTSNSSSPDFINVRSNSVSTSTSTSTSTTTTPSTSSTPICTPTTHRVGRPIQDSGFKPASLSPRTITSTINTTAKLLSSSTYGGCSAIDFTRNATFSTSTDVTTIRDGIYF